MLLLFAVYAHCETRTVRRCDLRGLRAGGRSIKFFYTSRTYVRVLVLVTLLALLARARRLQVDYKPEGSHTAKHS